MPGQELLHVGVAVKTFVVLDGTEGPSGLRATLVKVAGGGVTVIRVDAPLVVELSVAFT